jgi:hypothetical protein
MKNPGTSANRRFLPRTSGFLGMEPFVGYMHGIRSERRLEGEITLNMAHHRFCGFDRMDTIPDHYKSYDFSG